MKIIPPSAKSSGVPRGSALLKYGIPALAIVMLAFAIVSALPEGEADVPAPDVMPPISVYAHQVAGIGITEPSSENIAIGTERPGVVSGVEVQVGDKVSAGDVLFVLDTRETLARLQAAQAAHEAAQVAAQDAQAQLARYQNVEDRRAVSKEELSRVRYAAELAQARVKEAAAQVGVLEAELAQMHISAPIEGTILQVNVRPGEYAPAGMNNQPLIIMGDITPMHVRVEVDESDALRVTPEAGAMGTLRGYPQKRAELTFVRKEYYLEPKRSLTGDGAERVDTRVQQIIYAFDNSELGVYVGQQMDVFIDTPPRERDRK